MKNDTRFKPGNKAQALRKRAGPLPRSPVTPALAGDQTFRYLFRTYIREKPNVWFDEENENDTRFDKIIKKLGRELIAESTMTQSIISAFNYLEPIPKSELDGSSTDALPDYKKDLLARIDQLTLEGVRKLDAILEDQSYLKEKSDSLPSKE